VEGQRCRRELDAGEIDHLAALTANAGFKEFVAPVGLADVVRSARWKRRAESGACGKSARILVGVEFVDGFLRWGRDGLDGEGTGYAGYRIINKRLVVQCFSPGDSCWRLISTLRGGPFCNRSRCRRFVVVGEFE